MVYPIFYAICFNHFIKRRSSDMADKGGRFDEKSVTISVIHLNICSASGLAYRYVYVYRKKKKRKSQNCHQNFICL